jgi:outer membrane protein TolC
MRYLKLIILILFASAAQNTAHSAVIPAQLSLKDAVALSIHGNVNIKQAERAKLDSLSGYRKAGIETTYSAGAVGGAEGTPALLDLSNRTYGSLNYGGISGDTGSLTVSPYGLGAEEAAAAISISHPLMGGMGELSEKGNSVKSALSSISIQDKQFYLSEQSTVLGVIQAYYQAVLAREQVKVQESAVKSAEQNAEYMRKLEDAGSARGIDVTQSEVYVAQAKDSLNTSQLTARGSVDTLMVAIGFGVGQVPELTDDVPEAPPPPPSLEEANRIALKNRLELSVYDQQMVDAERTLAMKKDALHPQVNAVATFSTTNSNPGLLSGPSLNAGAVNMGVVLNLPLDQRAAKEDKETAERAIDILKQQKAFQIEQIVDQVRSSYQSYESAKTSYEIFSQNLSVAQENLRIAQRMVEEGEGDNRDVVSAQQNLSAVQGSILSAKTNLYLAVIRLRYTMGEDLTVMGNG